MNKISLLYCFSFLFFIIGSSSNQNIDNNLTNESDNYTKIFKYIVLVLRGMSKGNNGECVKGFISNEIYIIEEIKNIIDELEKDNFYEVLTHVSYILNRVQDECNMGEILSLLLKLYSTDTDFIKTLGLNTLKTSGCIEDNVNDIMEKPSLEEKLTSVGKVLSSILNIYIEKKE